MDEIEAVDLMLKDDADKNPAGKGFGSPVALFDRIGVPEEMRSYILQGVLELGLFEYNDKRIGIRATYLGRKIYRDGGYKKYKKSEKVTDWFGYFERAVNILKP